MVNARSTYVCTILWALCASFLTLGCSRHPSAEETGGETSLDTASQNAPSPRHSVGERVRVVHVPNGGLVPGRSPIAETRLVPTGGATQPFSLSVPRDETDPVFASLALSPIPLGRLPPPRPCTARRVCDP